MKKLTAKQARKYSQMITYTFDTFDDIEEFLIDHVALGFTNFSFETSPELGLKVAKSFIKRKFKVWQRVNESDNTLVTTELEW